MFLCLNFNLKSQSGNLIPKKKATTINKKPNKFNLYIIFLFSFLSLLTVNNFISFNLLKSSFFKFVKYKLIL